MASLDLPFSEHYEKNERHNLARPLTRCADDDLKLNVQEASCFPILSIGTIEKTKKSQLCTVPRYQKIQTSRDTLLGTQSGKYLGLVYAFRSLLRRETTSNLLLVPS
jgi:hypothetical protein